MNEKKDKLKCKVNRKDSVNSFNCVNDKNTANNWNKIITKRNVLLEQIYSLYKKYNKSTAPKKKEISITPFESHYAEYLVAKKLVDEGFLVQDMYGKGYDILCCNRKIEVKSGRLQRHVKGVKHDFWGWVIKEKQWRIKDHFDYFVGVALDDREDKIMVMDYDDVKRNFTKASWHYTTYNKDVRDYLKLSIVKDGYVAFEENVRFMRNSETKLRGKTSNFEKELNQNPEKAFEKYSWEKFIGELNSLN
jgi:hypothetical protein